MLGDDERELINKNTRVFKRTRTTSLSAGEKKEEDPRCDDGHSALVETGNGDGGVKTNEKSITVNVEKPGDSDLGGAMTQKSGKDETKPVKTKSKRRSEKDALRRANSEAAKKIKIDAALDANAVREKGKGDKDRGDKDRGDKGRGDKGRGDKGRRDTGTSDVVTKPVSGDRLDIELKPKDSSDIKQKSAGVFVKSEEVNKCSDDETKRSKKSGKKSETSNTAEDCKGGTSFDRSTVAVYSEESLERPRKRKKIRERSNCEDNEKGDVNIEEDPSSGTAVKESQNDIKESEIPIEAEILIDSKGKKERKEERKRRKDSVKLAEQQSSDAEKEPATSKRKVVKNDKAVDDETLKENKSKGAAVVAPVTVVVEGGAESEKKRKRRQKKKNNNKNSKSGNTKNIPELRVISK